MTFVLFIALGLAMGMVFGFALEKGRVFEPGMIVGQMQLRNFTMLKVFLTAVATGLVVLAVLNGVFGVALHPKATHVAALVIGGLVLGAGITLAGACPGTVLAQIGVGYRDAWFTLIGGILGAMTFAYLHPQIAPVLLSGGPGRLRLDQVLGMPFWAFALAFAAVLVAVLVALECWRPWRQDMGEDYDGLFPETRHRKAATPLEPTGAGRPIRVKVHGSVLHAMLRVGLRASGCAGNEQGL